MVVWWHPFQIATFQAAKKVLHEIEKKTTWNVHDPP